MLQNRWSHLFCISPFCVILTVIFYFVGQIENKSYFLPNQAVQTRENSIKNKFLLFDLDIQKICDIRCPENQENLGKRCIRISICPICLIYETIQRKIFFSLQILGVERHKHSIYPNGSAAREVLPSYKIFHKRGEVYRPASGFMKPCRNGVINKKEAVRMLLDDYSSILQQPLY